MKRFTQEKIAFFRDYLVDEERSQATLHKYMHDVQSFAEWLKGRKFGKNDVLSNKAALLKRYAIASVNSILSSLNSMFRCLGWNECKVRTVRLQHRILRGMDREPGCIDQGRR